MIETELEQGPKVYPANTFGVEVRITDARGRTYHYRLRPLAVDAGVRRAAWRLERVEEGGEDYAVSLGGHGWECECLGWLRHGKCKHVRVLIRLLGGGVS